MNITLDRDILDKVLHTLERHLSLIEDWGDNEELNRQHEAIIALRTALEQPEQEPVAWRFQSAVGGWAYGSEPPLGSKYPAYPLYTAPLQRKPLTDEEIILIVAECAASHQHTDIHFARAIERAHGIKELV